MKGLRWMILGAFVYDYLRKRKMVKELTDDKTQLLSKVSAALINPVQAAIEVSNPSLVKEESSMGTSEFGLDI